MVLGVIQLAILKDLHVRTKRAIFAIQLAMGTCIAMYHSKVHKLAMCEKCIIRKEQAAVAI